MSVRDVDECSPYFLTIKDDLYKHFVGFWTNHQRFTKRCDPDTCSKVFIVDGHQKASRLICQFKNVFDSTIPELGPVQVGCLFSPLRKGIFLTRKKDKISFIIEFLSISQIVVIVELHLMFGLFRLLNRIECSDCCNC